MSGFEQTTLRGHRSPLDHLVAQGRQERLDRLLSLAGEVVTVQKGCR